MSNNKYNKYQEYSNTGYTPNVYVTTGTYCVTMFSSQSSDKPYSEYFSSKK